MRGPCIRNVVCACAGILAVLAFKALAQTQERSVAPQPEPLPPPRFLEPREPPFQLPPLEPAPPAPREGAQVQVNEVRFEGNTVIPTEELQKVAAPYAGRQLYAAEIEELRRALTQHYIDRGYVNSGALLIGVERGVLSFRIVEGKVSQIQIRGLERLNEGYVTGRLLPHLEEPLNLNILRERFQLLLDDPLFARINARLMPGEKAGEAILDLEVVRALPYQLSVFANNYRPPSIGEIAVGLSGNVRNLTGYGDLADFRWQQTTDTPHSDTYALGWRLPVGRYGTAVSLRLDRGQSIVVEPPLNALSIKSKVDSTDIGISHPFLETLRHKFTLGVNYVDETVESSLLGIPFSFTPGVPEGKTEARLHRFWQEYAFRSQTKAVVVRSTFTSEKNNQDAAGGSGTQAPPSYRYWLGQFQYAQRLGDSSIQAVLKGVMQRAGTTLLPVDRLSIGGVNTVRGYRENQLLGDKGELLSLQLDVPVPTGGSSFPQVVASPFLDWGRVTNVGLASSTLSSAGLALKVAWKGARLDLFIAKRLEHAAAIDNLKGSLQDDRVHVQLAYDFF